MARLSSTSRVRCAVPALLALLACDTRETLSPPAAARGSVATAPPSAPIRVPYDTTKYFRVTDDADPTSGLAGRVVPVDTGRVCPRAESD